MIKIITFIKKVIQLIIPPYQWRMRVTIILGIFAGLGIYAFYVANATSYLSDEPNACINCHVMYPQYTTWRNSSHANVTNCNDCHVPQDLLVRKYFFKAADGLRHSTIFTLRTEPQAIRIKQAGIGVVQENCISCHIDMVDMIKLVEVTGKNNLKGEGHLCWDCHTETPHGKMSSLSSTPGSLIPTKSKNIPEWLQEQIKKSKSSTNYKNNSNGK